VKWRQKHQLNQTLNMGGAPGAKCLILLDSFLLQASANHGIHTYRQERKHRHEILHRWQNLAR
jgi:hypothetical protein